MDDLKQNEYHFWEGSFKGLSPEGILALSDEDFSTLLKEFYDSFSKTNLLLAKNLKKDAMKNDFFKSNEPYLKKQFKRMLKNFGYQKGKEIHLFRSIEVNDTSEVNLDEKGICWTPTVEALPYLEELLLLQYKTYIVRFYGITDASNVDWIESLFLYIFYKRKEQEIRVYDSKKVFLDGYVCMFRTNKEIFSETGNNTMLLSKNLHISGEYYLKTLFDFNSETGKYDSDTTVGSSVMRLLISKDGKGFIVDFGKITGDFDCSDLGLTSLKGAPQEVGGYFDCSYNQLTSLEGAPQEVGGDFHCYWNELTSLEGAPQTIGGGFSCSNNKLTSLKGAPQEIGWDFYCSDNQLTSLEGAPQIVDGNFACFRNKLTSLEGAPQEVGGNFNCHSNQLTSLKGAPKIVGKGFYCHYNKLTSLKGAPQTVGENFYCYGNQLTSLEGAPQEVGGKFDCSDNRLTSLEGAPKKVDCNFICYWNSLISLKGAPQEVGWNFDCHNNQLTSLKGAPREVGEYFNCRNNPNLHSLDGIGEVKGDLYKDF